MLRANGRLSGRRKSMHLEQLRTPRPHPQTPLPTKADGGFRRGDGAFPRGKWVNFCSTIGKRLKLVPMPKPLTAQQFLRRSQ
jgi:hypothetical protein